MRWLALLLLAGCQGAAAESRVELTAADLPESSVSAEGVWESAPFASEGSTTTWIDYPGRVTLVVPHALGRQPRNVFVYLSFEETGTGAGLAAGDLARILDVGEDTLTVRNDTNGDYFVRVVAQ